MNLIDEAVIIEIFGVRMYAFGVYVALGALCAMVTLGLTAYWLRMKKGTAALTALYIRGERYTKVVPAG